MTHKERFENLGIQPPKGVLLYGPPGTGTYVAHMNLNLNYGSNQIVFHEPFSSIANTTVISLLFEVYTFVHCSDCCLNTGKTLLARACAAQTKSTFLKLAGPQLVQMFIGDGAKLVRDAFALAKEKAPAIIFIDELDAIGMSLDVDWLYS